MSTARAVANANVSRAVLTNPETYTGATGGVVPLRDVIAASGLEPNQFEADILSSLAGAGHPIPTGGAANLNVPADIAKDIVEWIKK